MTMTTKTANPSRAQRDAMNSSPNRTSGLSTKRLFSAIDGSLISPPEIVCTAIAGRTGKRRRGMASALARPASCFALQPDARVQQCIDDVDGKIDDGEYQHDHDQIGDDDRAVEGIDAIDDQLAHAGPGKHRLGDDGKRDG